MSLAPDSFETGVKAALPLDKLEVSALSSSFSDLEFLNLKVPWHDHQLILNNILFRYPRYRLAHGLEPLDCKKHVGPVFVEVQ